MHRVVRTLPARADLRRINVWMIDNAGPDYAIRTLSGTRERANFLRDFPRAARPWRDGTRVLCVLHAPYVVVYRVQGSVVEILRVHHQSQDWQLET